MMARPKREGLGERHKRILLEVDAFRTRHGYPPTIREIGDKVGIHSTSMVNYYLEQLEAMGYIDRTEGISRGIRLLPAAHQVLASLRQPGMAATSASRRFNRPPSEVFHIPLVGIIAAGQPIPVLDSDFSYFDPESMVEVAASLLPEGEKGNDLFALQVKGDSMIDAMVYDGDLVIMKPTSEALNGEMVAVWLADRGETTLKYFYLEKGRVRLQPANPTMEPIYINNPSDLRIQGKVVMVIRQVSGRQVKAQVLRSRAG